MIGERLKQLRRELNLNQIDFAKEIQIRQSTLSQYESKNSIPSELIEKIYDVFQINIGWLVTGKGEIFGKFEDLGKYKNLAFVPLLPGNVSAGHGLEIVESEIIDNVPIPKDLLFPYDVDSVQSYKVKGDSMTPTINSGEYVFFIPDLIEDSDIYVISVFGELKCKRLQFHLDGSISIISDNKYYKEEKFSRDDQTIRICGKVIVWTHKQF